MDSPPVEVKAFAVPEVMYAVLMEMTYEEILAAANSSALLYPDQQFWTTKVLQELKAESIEQVKEALDHQIAMIHPIPDDEQVAVKIGSKKLYSRFWNFAVDSIYACRVAYVGTLAQIYPDMLAIPEIWTALVTFYEKALNMDCIRAYDQIFAGTEKYNDLVMYGKRRDDTWIWRKEVREILGVRGITAKGRPKYSFFVNKGQGPEDMDHFFKCLAGANVMPCDFRRLLAPVLLPKTMKPDVEFYSKLANTLIGSCYSKYIKAKCEIMASTPVATHRPIQALIGGKQKAIDLWRILCLPEENIVEPKIVKWDVTEEGYGAAILSIIGGAGGERRNSMLERALNNSMLILVWNDQAANEHSFKLTSRSYRTFRETLLELDRTGELPQWQDYRIDMMPTKDVQNLRVFELGWKVERLGVTIPVGGASNSQTIKSKLLNDILLYVVAHNNRIATRH